MAKAFYSLIFFIFLLLSPASLFLLIHPPTLPLIHKVTPIVSPLKQPKIHLIPKKQPLTKVLSTNRWFAVVHTCNGH